MKLLKTKIALVAATVTFASAASAAELTIQPTLEVSNALTLTQVPGTTLNFGRIRAQSSATADDCRTLYIPANPANQATTTKPSTIGTNTVPAGLCTDADESSLSILSPVGDLTTVSFEVTDAAPFTPLSVTVNHTADIASPDPSAAVFEVQRVDVFRTTLPTAVVNMVEAAPGDRISKGSISTDTTGSVAFNLGALISTEVGAAEYIDASYTGSIIVTVDY